ncbi:uncharacterized protein EKO05_0004127 [Ascochyta rabiei]|uniref:uncharacterized protein n=1 Tax=Didymella rabiei TaxID=5454 RepID=UPI0021FC08E3|nr:uncharacterized protein EKO05_0004127 [Ascochyta rabiei]UPX13626.1 hypothetical protein EKO05_0004127 [Ascochyta rabiei]
MCSHSVWRPPRLAGCGLPCPRPALIAAPLFTVFRKQPCQCKSLEDVICDRSKCITFNPQSTAARVCLSRHLQLQPASPPAHVHRPFCMCPFHNAVSVRAEGRTDRSLAMHCLCLEVGVLTT